MEACAKNRGDGKAKTATRTFQSGVSAALCTSPAGDQDSLNGVKYGGRSHRSGAARELQY